MDDVLRALDGAIGALRRPLAAADREAGWDDELRESVLARLERLRPRLAAGGTPEGEQHHLMRWLNFEGVATGPLSDLLARVQRELWDRYATREERTGSEGHTGADARRLLRQIGVRPRRERGR